MSDDSPLAPFAYEGLDPVPESKSTIAEVSDAVKRTVNRVIGAIEAGRKPGMPLSILSNIAREAPLFAAGRVPVGGCRGPSPIKALEGRSKFLEFRLWLSSCWNVCG